MWSMVPVLFLTDSVKMSSYDMYDRHSNAITLVNVLNNIETLYLIVILIDYETSLLPYHHIFSISTV